MCNNSSCGCSSNPCLNLGPYTAFDPQCPTSQVRPSYMIPYASNNNFTLNYDPDEPQNNRSAQIGFGSNAVALIAGDGTISLNNASPNEAFAVSQAGCVTAISATLSNPIVAIGGPGEIKSVEVRAQLYKAPARNNVFSPTNVNVILLSKSDNIAPNSTFVNSSSVFPPVPIAVGERLLMVYSMTVTGNVDFFRIFGTASASITIV